MVISRERNTATTGPLSNRKFRKKTYRVVSGERYKIVRDDMFLLMGLKDIPVTRTFEKRADGVVPR